MEPPMSGTPPLVPDPVNPAATGEEKETEEQGERFLEN